MVVISLDDASNSIVTIARFNNGEASCIFDEVEVSGTKMVMDNGQSVCILMSLGKYEELMEMLSDYILKEEAERRMGHYDSVKVLTEMEVMEHFGITESDLENIDVEIE